MDTLVNGGILQQSNIADKIKVLLNNWKKDGKRQ